MHELIKSQNFTVWAEYETVYIDVPGGGQFEVGWMYGDPQKAIISWDERFVVIIGAGVLVVRLEQLKFLIKSCDFPTEKVLNGVVHDVLDTLKDVAAIHLCVGYQEEILWFEMVYEVSDKADQNVVRLVCDVWSEAAGIYELSLNTLQMQKIFPRDEDFDLLIL